MPLQTLLRCTERTISAIAIASAWVLLPLMIAVRTFDIVARQFMNTPGTYIQFVEWRAFTMLVMLGFAYAYLRDAHVRIDILKNRLAPRTQVWIEVVGFLVGIVPFCIVVIWYGSEFALQSYHQFEREVVAFGRPVQWVVKSLVPFGGLMLLLAGAVVFTRNVLFLLNRAERPGFEPGFHAQP